MGSQENSKTVLNLSPVKYKQDGMSCVRAAEGILIIHRPWEEATAPQRTLGRGLPCICFTEQWDSLNLD